MRYHVMGHAVDGELLFRDAEDRWTFIRRTALVVQQEDAVIEAHAEMPNHFHFCLLTRSTSISVIMQRIESAYSHYYNARYGRTGHLLRDRFLSKIISTADYRITALLYVHCNPLKAGIVRTLEELETYPFTGHAALMGNGIPWIQDLAILRLFGRSRADARRALRRQMADALASIPEDEAGWFDPEDAVTREEIETRAGARASAEMSMALTENVARRGRAAQLRAQWPIEDLVRELAHEFGMLKRDVVGRRRADGVSEVRAVICHVATRVLGYSPSFVAATLAITPAAVCLAARRGSAIVASDPLAYVAFTRPRGERTRDEIAG